jgi:DNA-directed RNA polymerase specialized sigma24 family protein
MKPNERSTVGPTNLSRKDFDRQFLSCKGLLKQIAERVLNGTEAVEEAIERSYAAAAIERRRFRSDGEFRRWLVRAVLNEALTILRERESAVEGSSELIFWQVC